MTNHQNQQSYTHRSQPCRGILLSHRNQLYHWTNSPIRDPETSAAVVAAKPLTAHRRCACTASGFIPLPGRREPCEAASEPIGTAVKFWQRAESISKGCVTVTTLKVVTPRGN